MAYLEIETGDGQRKVPLSRERLSIGRLSFNDVTLPSPQISRQHAELRRIDGVWWIADLNSTNGMHLHGQRIAEHRLSHGDQIVLAPNITVRFVEEADDSGDSGFGDQLFSSSHTPGWVASAGSAVFSARDVQPVGERGANLSSLDLAEQSKTHPIGSRVIPSSGQIYPPVASPAPMAQGKPRSIYADDEVPFVPSSMAPPASPLSPPPPLAPAPSYTPALEPASATVPFSSWSGMAPESDPGVPVHQIEINTYDPYRRSAPAGDNHLSNGGLGNGNLLHVCQTCGQLTSPEAVYCQNCRHSIAHECINCRLSLLPIQDRCPRCHTPNEASVKRSHPGR